MITIDAAIKSVDRLTGVFVLIMVITFIIFYIYVNHVRREESKLAFTKCKAEMKKLNKQRENEIRKIQTHNFVKSFEATERIRELEQQLADAQKELRLTQANYNRLQQIAERVSNGKN